MKPGWQIKKLGHLCEIELGKTPARANRAFWDEERETSNVWLSIADLLNIKDNTVFDSKEYVSDKGALICKLVRKGTLLVSFKLTLGRLAFAGRDLFTNEAIAALTIINEQELSKEFLFYFLTFFDWRKAAENDVKIKGMTLNKEKLKELLVQYPSLPEQQRLVRLLDEVFDSLAIAKANVEKNLVDSRELFESVLQGLYESAGKGWEERKLGDIASEMQTGPFGSMLHKSDYVANGIPVVNPQNIVDGKIFPLQKMMVSGRTKERLSRYILQERDIILARRGEMGRCALVEKEQVGWLCGSGSFVIRIKKEVNANYLVCYLSSAKVKRILQKGSVGATMDNLNQGILAQIPVPFPPLDEQRAIVTKLASIREETERLKSIYQNKLAALDELKKSLLHQAFNGDL